MPTLTPVSADSLTLAPVVDGSGYAGFYPSSSTYPSSSLYPGIEETGTSSLSFGAFSAGTVTSDDAALLANMVPNGDFEYGINQWGTANSTITQDTTHVLHGTYSLKCVTANAVASEGFDRSTVHPLGGQSIAGLNSLFWPIQVIPGGTYTVTWRIWGTGANTLRGIIDEYPHDLSALILSTNTGVVTPPAAWTAYTATVTASATTFWLNLRVLTNVQQNFTFWVDEITLYPDVAAASSGTLTLTPA